MPGPGSAESMILHTRISRDIIALPTVINAGMLIGLIIAGRVTTVPITTTDIGIIDLITVIDIGTIIGATTGLLGESAR